MNDDHLPDILRTALRIQDPDAHFRVSTDEYKGDLDRARLIGRRDGRDAGFSEGLLLAAVVTVVLLLGWGAVWLIWARGMA